MDDNVQAITQAGNVQPQQNPMNMLQSYALIKNALAQNALIQGELPLLQQNTTNAQIEGQQRQLQLTDSSRSFWAGAVSAYSYLPLEQQTRANYHGLINQYEGYLGQSNPTATAQLESFRKEVDNTPEGAPMQTAAHQVGMSMAPPQVQQQMAGTQGSVTDNQQTYPVTRPGVGMPNAGALILNGSNVPGTTPQGGIRMQAAPTWQNNYNPATGQNVQQPSPPLGPNGRIPAAPIPGNGGYVKPGSLPLPPPAPGTPPPAPGTVPPPASGQPQVASNGGYNAGAPIGTPENIQANIQAYNADAVKVPDAMDRIRNNQIALQALQLASTGKGTADWYALGQRLQSWGMVSDGSAWAKQINSQALAEKYTAMAIANSPAARSDAALAEVAKGSASTSIPNPVAQQVISTNIARDRMAIAQVRETKDPTTYLNTQSGQFPVNNDRRAFEWDLMTPTQQAAVKAELGKQGPKAQEAFAKSLGIAQKYFFPTYGQTQTGTPPAGQ